MAKPSQSTHATLVMAASTPGCPRCAGLVTLDVVRADTVIGRIHSEHPWWDDIPEDPALHPQTPHYQLSYWASTPQGDPIGSPGQHPHDLLPHFAPERN